MMPSRPFALVLLVLSVLSWMIGFTIFTPCVIYVLWKFISSFITQKHATKFNNLKDRINSVPKNRLRVAIIGSGISGIQAIKSCLEEGIEPFCLEADTEPCGFWRYKEDANFPSVYKSTHIDTERELVAYGDFPYSSTETLTLHNSRVQKYLQDNIHEFGLEKYIHCNSRVEFVSPKEKVNGKWKWEVKYTVKDPNDSDKTVTETQIFDGVLVCTGRHGGGGYVPNFKGLNDYEGQWMHSSQYKHPEKHELAGKTVVVVGIGNSGLDIVTEVSKFAKHTFLVSRSGAWIIKAEQHGNTLFAGQVRDRITTSIFQSLPWWIQSEIMERMGFLADGNFKEQQAVLNKHGLKPNHRFWQQHLLVTGLHDPENSLHNQLERGIITVKHGIVEFNKKGLIFTDNPDEVIEADTVIFATGYKQCCNFVDPKVVDMRFDRKGNDVLMFKHIFPLSEYTGLGFVNFVQSITFLCADLQTRLFMKVLKGEVVLPSLEEQRRDAEDTRQALCSQFMDRQQLRIQTGIFWGYYFDLSNLLGCEPTFWRLLTERPTALWHSYFVELQPLQFRLVGTGRLEKTEEWIETYYNTRYYREGKSPNNRGTLLGYLRAFFTYTTVGILYISLKIKGYTCSMKIKDHLSDYLAYAKKDTVPHCLNIGEEASDVKELGGKNLSVWNDEKN